MLNSRGAPTAKGHGTGTITGPAGIITTGRARSSLTEDAMAELTLNTVEVASEASTDIGSNTGLKVTSGEGQISRFAMIAKHTSFLRMPARDRRTPDLIARFRMCELEDSKAEKKVDHMDTPAFGQADCSPYERTWSMTTQVKAAGSGRIETQAALPCA